MSVQLARRVRHEVTERAMDARAHGMDQDQRIARLDTPEIDSQIERVRALRDVPVPGHEGVFLVRDQQITELEDDCWFLAESNGREGQLQRKIAGSAESIATDLYATASRIPLRPSQLAAQLRDPLAVIEQMQDPRRRNPSAREIAVATTAIRTIVQQVPADTLLSRGLAHELRASKTAVLRQFVDAQARKGGAA